MKKYSIFIKSIFLLIAFLFSNPMVCQGNRLKEIDDLLVKADSFNKRFKDINELKTARRANLLAEKAGDEQRKAKSTYYIARSLFNLGLLKESLSHAEKGNSEKYITKDPVQKALFTELKGYLYRSLNLHSQSITEFNNAFSLLRNNSSIEASEIKSRLYANLAENAPNPDSALAYYNLQKQELKKLPEKKYFSAFCEYYNYVGYSYLKKKKPDSAIYYFKNSYALKQKYKDPVLYEQYFALASYYNHQNEHKH